MSQKSFTAEQLEQIATTVQSQLDNDVYIPVFQKTATELGVAINSTEDLRTLLELAAHLRQNGAQKQASTGSRYTGILEKVRGNQKTASVQDVIQQTVEAYTAELVKDEEFIKVAKVANFVSQQATQLQ